MPGDVTPSPRRRAALFLFVGLACLPVRAAATDVQLEYGFSLGTLSDTRIFVELDDFSPDSSDWPDAPFVAASRLWTQIEGPITRRRTVSVPYADSFYFTGPLDVAITGSHWLGTAGPFPVLRGRLRPTVAQSFDDREEGDQVTGKGQGRLEFSVAKALGVSRNVRLESAFLLDEVRGVPGTEREVVGGCCSYVTITTSAVPAPSVATLLLAGVTAGLVRWWRRRTTRSSMPCAPWP